MSKHSSSSNEEDNLLINKRSSSSKRSSNSKEDSHNKKSSRKRSESRPNLKVKNDHKKGNDESNLKLNKKEKKDKKLDKIINKTKDNSNVVLLKDETVNKKWQNALIRGVWSLFMVGSFSLILYLGHFYICLLVGLLQFYIYSEVINIGVEPGRQKKLPMNRFLHWWFLATTEYFLYGESLTHYFTTSVNKFLTPLAVHHRFISFSLYVTGLVLFVLSLRKGEYQFQFSQFGWTHMVLLIVIVQSHFMINNIFEGIFWFLLPAALVICNDIMAYIFGFFFGKTPLISLSPKKTWEGFIGALISTVIFGWIISGVLSKYPYMYCPVTDIKAVSYWSPTHNCEIQPVFDLTTYEIPLIVQQILIKPFEYLSEKSLIDSNVVRNVGRCLESKTFDIYPVQFHSIAISLFSSLIAPFGGFFASGLKRAFNIKDFGHSIPGHGGITDRMDCQLMMATFSYLYLQSFVRSSELVTVSTAFEYIISHLNKEQIDELIINLRRFVSSSN